MIRHVVLLVVQLSITFGEYVPVYMWSKVRLPDPVPALYPMTEESFKNLLHEYVKENKVIVFVEAYLSPEDFAQGKKVFVNMYASKEENNVNYLPSVQDPVNAIRQLGEEVKKEISIIELDNAQHEEMRWQMLNRHNSDIFAVYTARENNNVLAIYTSFHSSWSSSSRKHRHLLQFNTTDEEETYIVFATDQILLYLTSFGTYLHKSEKTIEINITKNFLLTSVVNSNKTDVFATLKGEGLEINFIIHITSGYWYVKSTSVHEYHKKVIYLKGTEDFYAPINYSFHCSAFNLTNEEQDVVLSLPGFQIQPLIERKIFGEAYDCVGFMTIGIASGVLMCGLLLVILFTGLAMLWHIKVIDRFDDPMGKTINIVTHD